MPLPLLDPTIRRRRHLAGRPDAEGLQVCQRCDYVITEPGLTPFEVGLEVLVEEDGRSRSRTPATIGESLTIPICISIH